MALAAAPMTAILLPCISTEWSHLAVCIPAPLKVSRPGKSGMDGTCKPPLPLITSRAFTVLPSSNITFHRPAISSNINLTIFSPWRICAVSPYFVTQCSIYVLISPCAGYILDQLGLGSNE